MSSSLFNSGFRCGDKLLRRSSTVQFHSVPVVINNAARVTSRTLAQVNLTPSTSLSFSSLPSLPLSSPRLYLHFDQNRHHRGIMTVKENTTTTTLSLPHLSSPIPAPLLYYDGKLQHPTPANSQPESHPIINPSTSATVGTFSYASPADINLAIASASNAFPRWRTTSAPQRARILRKAASIVRERADDLARLETTDTGRPVSETSGVDVQSGAEVLEYYAGLIASGGLNGEASMLRQGAEGEAWMYRIKEPLGVCAAIGAWNYPLQIALWKSAPALAAGNTLVYKPSEHTPLHATVLASIYADAGLPPGVFNVLQGDGPTVGRSIISHQAIAKVSFTGQVSTGREVAATAARDMKAITMELGGKSALIILKDCDVTMAVDGAMMANFFSSGQVCTNGTRVFVPKGMRAEFERMVVEKMKGTGIRVGDPMDPDTNFGPLVSEVHRQKVRRYIKHGIEVDKATLLYGGIGPDDDDDDDNDRSGNQNPPFLENLPTHCQNGTYLPPTIFTSCTDDMLITREEIFGPVMTILTYENEEEVIRRANNTTLGLAAGVFSKDINAAHRVVAQLEAGITWINTWGESPAEMSVGGWKMSGVGVENGREGIEGWVRGKSTLVEMSGSVPTVF